MQTVERIVANCLPIFDEIDRLYAHTSTIQVRELIPPVFDKRVYPIVDKFNLYSDNVWNFDYISKGTGNGTLLHGDDPLVLAFSGGKDSIASALKYRDEGRDVVLYHMHGVNSALSDEAEASKELARMLDLPIIFDTLRYHGKHIWMEHPMKNMLIAIGALNYSIPRNRGYTLGFANYQDTYLSAIPFHCCAGDCVDMWSAFEEAVSQDLPDFKVHLNLANLGETMDIVCPREELLDASISCLCRHSLREYRHQWVKDKFGVTLPRHRCGSCAKCTAEYIYRVDHGLTAFSEEYYRYCMNQLYKVTWRGEGDGVYKETPQEVFETFLMYPIEQSRICDQIKNAKLQGANIKW